METHLKELYKTTLDIIKAETKIWLNRFFLKLPPFFSLLVNVYRKYFIYIIALATNHSVATVSSLWVKLSYFFVCLINSKFVAIIKLILIVKQNIGFIQNEF